MCCYVTKVVIFVTNITTQYGVGVDEFLAILALFLTLKIKLDHRLFTNELTSSCDQTSHKKWQICPRREQICADMHMHLPNKAHVNVLNNNYNYCSKR